ncbi:MAG TPA: GntR family transcriptional regulator [Draconibacterium sp.]|nr:GntR family transcriptional regulator [Draconibacterium sp.]
MKTKTSNAQSAYFIILKKIIDLELKPGETITEVSLSEKLGISRTPVRDAIQRLEMEGLIVSENRTKKIYFLTPRDIENIFDLKIAIESTLSGLAARKGTDKQMDDLSNIVLRIREQINDLKSGRENENTFFKKWIDTDRQFHAKIAEMADNSRAEQIINTLNTQWHRIKMGLSAIEGRMEKSAVEHETIGKEIISRDAQAAEKAMADHLSNLKNVLLKIMQAFNF